MDRWTKREKAGQRKTEMKRPEGKAEDTMGEGGERGRKKGKVGVWVPSGRLSYLFTNSTGLLETRADLRLSHRAPETLLIFKVGGSGGLRGV